MRYSKKQNADLQRAVRSYNAILRRLQQRVEYKDVILPPTTSVKELKSRIQNRKDLQREINSLNRIKDKNAKDIVVNQQGVRYTKYEKKEIAIKYRTARAKQTRELKRREKTPVKVSGEETGYTRGQMYTNRLEELEVKLKNRSETARNEGEFRAFVKRIERILMPSYYADKDELYKRNYMDAVRREMGFYADEINELVSQIPASKLVDLYYSDQDMDIDYVYSETEQKARYDYIIKRLREELGLEVDEVE